MRVTQTTRVVAGVVAALVLLASMAFGPGASRARTAAWAAAPLETARASHTATLLPDGKVLAAGGFGSAATGQKALASAEVYDPAANKWTATKPLATPRKDQTATLLPDGRVLVVGGSDGDNSGGKSLNSVEVYDAKTQTWTGAASLATPRTDHTATLLPDGKVLVTGGYDTSSGSPVAVATAEVYDPATNKWTGAGTLGSGRANASASLLPDGRVMVVGGETSSAAALSSAEIYNPSTNSWTGTKSLAGQRTKLTTTALPDGRVLAVGGDPGTYCATAELYNPKTDTWTGTATLSTSRQRHTATLLPDGRVMIVGGDTAVARQMSALSSRVENSLIEIFQPDLNTFVPGGEIPGGISNQQVTLLPNGQILISGGIDSTGMVLSESTELPPPPPVVPTAPPTATTVPVVPTATTAPVPPTATTAPVVVPTATTAPAVPTATSAPPTATSPPPAPTATSAPAATQAVPTATVAPTATPVPPTATMIPPTATAAPTATPEPPPPPAPTATTAPPPPPPTPTFAPLQPAPTATTAAAPGFVSGTITCNNTQCTGPVTIQVDTGQNTTAGGGSYSGNTTTYTIRNVPPGTRTVTASSTTGGTKTQTVTVPPGGGASANFTFTASNNAPLAGNPNGSLAAVASSGSSPDDVGASVAQVVNVASNAPGTALVAASSAPCSPTSGQPAAGAPAQPGAATTPGTGGASTMPRTGGGGGQRDPFAATAVFALVMLALATSMALTRRPRRRQPVIARSTSKDQAPTLPGRQDVERRDSASRQ